MKKIKIKLPHSLEAGDLGVLHIPRMWTRAILKTRGQLKEENTAAEWKLDLIIMNGLGLGMEETIQALFQKSSSRDFETWILQKNNGSISKEKIELVNKKIRAELSGENDNSAGENKNIKEVLTKEDLDFWDENGYVIIRNAITEENCKAAEKAVWDFLEMNPAGRQTWYKHHPAQQGIMVQFFQHPALEANRRSGKIKNAFAQLWGTDNLMVSTDRVSFNPPENDKWHFPGPNLHWDTSVHLPIPLGLQGILYLTDVKEEQGAFTCVPGFHKRIDEWINSLPAGVNPREQNLVNLGAKPISANAGDFIIWHHALPHGSRPNRENYPRIVQYITWMPPGLEDSRPWV